VIRRAAVLFMLGLVLFAAFAPFLEAACPGEDCTGDAPFGGCSLDLCCSCCVHVRVHPPLAYSFLPQDASRGFLCGEGTLRLVRSDPREILHVPKPIRSV
jgi:hypothetical protein